MKVGLYFGSFDPPHVGHTIIAEYVLSHYQADEIWLVISPQSPFKRERQLTDENIRLELVKKALGGHEAIKACDHEFRMPRPSYTIDTLESLTTDHPDKEFFLIMGSDNLLGIEGWKSFEKIIEKYALVVYPRPGHEVSQELVSRLEGQITIVNAPLMALSSTEIRKSISEDRPCRMMVREAVWGHIDRAELYKD